MAVGHGRSRDGTLQQTFSENDAELTIELTNTFHLLDHRLNSSVPSLFASIPELSMAWLSLCFMMVGKDART